MKKYLFYLVSFAGLLASSQEISAPLKIGDEFEVNFTANSEYNSTDSGIVYSKEFRSNGSGYIKIYFENFDLNDNDFVRVYGATTNEEYIYSGTGKIVNQNQSYY